MEQNHWFCMKKLMLSCLKARRNTLSVWPQIEGFVVLTISWLLNRWKVRWLGSQQPGNKLRLLQWVIKLGLKLGLQRTHSNQLLVTFKEVGRKTPTFGDVSVISLELLNSGYEIDEGSIVFNQFRSVFFYQTEEKPVFSLNTIASAESMSIYDDTDADTLQNYQEYNLADTRYYSLKESATSEQSARMTAMHNVSKNASETIDKLTLTSNRTRQAVSTKELIEIISGAAALD